MEQLRLLADRRRTRVRRPGVVALVGLFRNRGNPRPLTYVLLLLVTWVLGFINALEHAKDAWAAMPMGLALSVIVTLLACAATWVGLAQPRTGDAR